MADLSVKYLGLDLANPVIIGSSPLTSNIDNLVKCQKAGCGAVVLKSIFEEQIEERIEGEVAANEQYLAHSDSVEAYEAISRNYYINNYLELLRKAKKELSIPVIASVNCIDLASWVDYVAAFEDAGCDALELNYYPIASDSSTEGSDVDARLISFAKTVKSRAEVPVSIKIGYKYSSLANIISRLDRAGVDGIVLFNRFFRPDIDIEAIAIQGAANPLSSPDEYAESLRWTALMSAEVGCDICASTGIHDGESVIKLLLAGAASCQVCSAAIKDIGVVGSMLETLSSWMGRHGFASVADFRGRLAQEKVTDGGLWERTQYMKRLTGEEM